MSKEQTSKNHKYNLFPPQIPSKVLGKVVVKDTKLLAECKRRAPQDIPFEFFYDLGQKLEQAGFTEKIDAFAKRSGVVVETKYFPWATLHVVLKLFYGDTYTRLHRVFGETQKPYQFHQEVDITDNTVLRTQVFTVTEGFSLNGKEFWLTQPLQGFTYRKTQPHTYYGKEVVFAQQRTFAKAVAIHTGLGLHLWEREDVPVPTERQLVQKPLVTPTNQGLFKPKTVPNWDNKVPTTKRVTIDIPQDTKHRKGLWE